MPDPTSAKMYFPIPENIILLELSCHCQLNVRIESALRYHKNAKLRV